MVRLPPALSPPTAMCSAAIPCARRYATPRARPRAPPETDARAQADIPPRACACARRAPPPSPCGGGSRSSPSNSRRRGRTSARATRRCRARARIRPARRRGRRLRAQMSSATGQTDPDLVDPRAPLGPPDRPRLRRQQRADGVDLVGHESAALSRRCPRARQACSPDVDSRPPGPPTSCHCPTATAAIHLPEKRTLHATCDHGPGLRASGLPGRDRRARWEVIDPQAGDAREPNIVDKPGGINNPSAFFGVVPYRKLRIVILANHGGWMPHAVSRMSSAQRRRGSERTNPQR